ncbi:MAG: M23 family metallopeptidase [Oscillospiraceae bacterium]|nr:M23 family metallopeptidase [Oscillospiraceae bacterium]
MNFKKRNSNITKVLYIVLVLCIVSIMFLSIYSMFNQSETQNQSNANLNLNGGENNNNNADSEEAILDFFRRRETEPQTEPATETKTEPQTQPREIDEREIPEPIAEPQTDLPGNNNNNESGESGEVIEPAGQENQQNQENQEEPPLPTDRTADFIDDSVRDAIEVFSNPSVFARPVQGQVLKLHSPNTHEYCLAMNDYRTHAGIDIESEIGAGVKSVSDGVVYSVHDDPLMGKTVVIEHYGGIKSIYKNLHETIPANITPGAQIKSGETIGLVGQTALIETGDVPHLHFEMTKDGEPADPFDYIGF